MSVAAGGFRGQLMGTGIQLKLKKNQSRSTIFIFQKTALDPD